MHTASERSLSYFEQAGHIRHLTKDEILHVQGDPSSNIYLIARGRVRLFFVNPDGRQITYRIVGERQLIGESAFLEHAGRPVTVLAVTDVTLIACPVERLLPFLQESRELSETILALLTDNYTALCSQIRRLAIYNSTQRVASYLLDHTAPGHDGVGVICGSLPYTHEELGGCLNLNRVTVTRILNDFRRRQLVALERKCIRVLDREGLQAILLAEEA